MTESEQFTFLAYFVRDNAFIIIPAVYLLAWAIL